MIAPYFDYDFPEDIKEWIIANWSPDADLSCLRESHQWAKRLLEQFFEIDLEVHEGMALLDGDPEQSEGHTWLVIEGVVFDPTRDQFECDFIEYDTHMYWDSDGLLEYLAEYGYVVQLASDTSTPDFNI